GTTTIVSVDSSGAQSAASPSGVKGSAISADGNFVAFETAGTLVTGDGNGVADVFVRDRVNNRTERVSTTAAGAEAPAGGASNSRVDISAEGRYVVFESADTTLVTPDAGGFVDVFRKDRTTGAIIRASQKSDGTQANASSALTSGPVISPEGRFVAFPSAASNLVSTSTDSTPGNVDVFVHDAVSRQTVRVSEGSEANGPSNGPTLSAGSEAAFDSTATNLVTPDTNGAVSDIYARHFRRPVGSFVLDNVGGIFTFGTATFRGSVPALRAAGTPVGSANIVDLEVTPSGNGYYVLDDAGGIFTFGDAGFFGSVPGLRASGVSIGPGRILDMAVTPTGLGYLILDDAGGIFAFGDATFFGSIPQLRAAGVAVGSARGVDLAMTPNGRGYLILDDQGGIFTFGDGAFFGSLPGLRAAGVNIGSAPSIRMAISPSGNGYLVLDSVGGMFTFGDAQFFGSIPGLRNAGVAIGNAAGVDLAMTPTGNGYVILDSQGGMFTFGDGEFFGSIPQLRNAGVSIGPNSSIRVDLVSSLVGG
ncbi:MAG TPA: hypothetical protein VI916_02305, partial [Acidimicrobiia bacterium]|nr:hypothetical protein [Acidimicrobiia bacterium]